MAASSHINGILAAAQPESADEQSRARLDNRQRGDIAQSMQIAAALINAPSPPRVLYVHGWGDFDTHQGQVDRQGQLMAELDAALRSFFTAIAGSTRDVVVMTTSEFGRRVASNGSGTDHGTAGSQLFLGTAVSGGRYGETPSLSRLDRRGNMIHTVDYRSLYATVLDGFLDVPSAGVLGATFERLDVFG